MDRRQRLQEPLERPRGDGNSISASISGDGRFVAFDSAADNLSTEDDSATPDVFVRDLQSDVTTYISRAGGPAGTAGDAISIRASLSGDGRFVGFESDADNLSAEDDDAAPNIFRRTIGLDPPVNLTAPELSGRPVSGEVLSCSGGSWSDGALVRTWRRGGAAIAGASAAAYTLTDADVGTLIDCLVTATNADGFASEPSNPTLAGEEGSSELFAALVSSKLKAKAGTKKAVRFASSAAGEAEILAQRKGKTKVEASGSLTDAGIHKLKLKLFKKKPTSASGALAAKRKPIKPGKYKLFLTVTGTDGQTATDQATLKVKRK